MVQKELLYISNSLNELLNMVQNSDLPNTDFSLYVVL